MNLSETRDLVLAYLTEYGGKAIGRIPRTIVDNMINVEMQSHFNDVKTQHGYWHVKVQQNLDEYLLPDALLSPYYIAIAAERYYPTTYPYVEDAKRTATSRTRITEEGATVNAVSDRWYWILGRSLFIYPAPEAATGVAVTGSCTISGSTITVSSGSLGEDNSYKDYVVTIGSYDFVILSHDSSDIVVEGTPDDTATTYTIYEKGLQMRGIMTPASLTIGSDDNVSGTDLDANCIALKAAYNIALTKQNKDQQVAFDMGGLLGLYNEFRKRTWNDAKNTHSAPIQMSPWRMRSDHAG